ncbi:MAG TPA: P1 family peptidase, partial [Anaerolineae bacterium]|nr:P1 family peptidase [Anaerolineae bacterium]
MRPRTRDCCILIGALPTGTHNAITDVPGVKVGHSTLIEGEGALIPGSGPIRTGVTAVWPHSGDLFYEKVAACVHTINGFGEVTNSEQVHEMGVVEGPILITNTLNVPRVADYAIDWAFEHYPQMGITDWGISPVVAETSDMYLNDIRGRHVQREHVFAAIDGATAGPVEEGSVGGGTGMSCLGFKGGIGTASRIVGIGDRRFTVGVLVQSNFGRRGDLRIDGVPVGRELLTWLDEADRQHIAQHPERNEVESKGAAPHSNSHSNSIIIVVATDAPLTVRELRRVAVRASFGLARVGSMGGTTSGDFVIAFSNANRVAHRPDSSVYEWHALAEMVTRERPDDPPPISPFFIAAIEATEEAILNSMFKSPTMVGRD